MCWNEKVFVNADPAVVQVSVFGRSGTTERVAIADQSEEIIFVVWGL